MEISEKLHGFIVRSCRPLEELKAKFYEMEHEKTGAKLVWIDRPEENKTFGIAFETLPWDDTGVFHILEHSVLCGSDRYPVKEPFVELMKSSMNTFLNAMTFPDKTFYPISSRNHKDFMNLARVYLDAVFFPLIHSKPEIMAQEGWHYEFDGNGEPSYKGVVFNEMKGAMADPDSVTFLALSRALFPDSPYRFESGGDPISIPDLTYDAFTAAHRKFYAPSNSYIFLDGAVDIGAVLAMMDQEYLSRFSRTERMAPPPVQRAVDAGVRTVEYELGEGEDPAKRTRLTWGRVVGTFDQQEKLVASQLLSQVLCGDNQAPLKKLILSQGLAEDVTMDVQDEMLQPILFLQLKNMAAADVDKANALLTAELERLSREGLDRDRLKAAMANREFKMRERDFGSYPQGLILGMQALGTWLYGGDPAATLEVGDLFLRLEKKMEEGYFEQLIREIILDNPHRCQVVLSPSKTAGEARRKQEADRLAAEAAAWSDADRKALVEQGARLTAWQESSDTPEALATLPVLTLADVSPEPELIPTQVSAPEGTPLLFHDINTGGVLYANLYFDASDCGEEELCQLTFLSALLGKLATARHSGAELANLSQLLCGSLNFQVSPYANVHQDGRYGVNLQVSFSALEHNAPAALELVSELLSSTRWEEDTAALDLLRQKKLELFQAAVMAGHSLALNRVIAQLSASGVAGECSRGLTYYQWLAAQESAWNWSELSGKLAALLSRVANSARLTVSVTNGSAQLADSVVRQLKDTLPTGQASQPGKLAPWGVRREGVVIPADISFAVLGGKLPSYGGAADLAAQIVSLAYLWNVIRVQGGAYGTGLAASRNRFTFCYSYRDPAAAQSLVKYQGCGDFLKQFCAAKPDLTGFIIGAVAANDPLLTPRLKGSTADNDYWTGVTAEDLRTWRRELLSATVEDLTAFADELNATLAQNSICVVGSKPQLDACGLDCVLSL